MTEASQQPASETGRPDAPQTTSPKPPGMPTTAPPAAPSGEPSSPLEKIQHGVVGRWVGKAHDPEADAGAWSLWLDLHADGRYSAGCLDESCKAAFGEGNDGDFPTKTYAIYDLDGGRGFAGVGELYVLIGADAVTEPASWRAELVDVRLSADGESLVFDLYRIWRSDLRPIRYELRRAKPGA